jgi:DNA replication protein DnaC
LGYVQLSAVTTQLLFQVISDRYERGSILLSSNLEFSEWTQIFCTDYNKSDPLDPEKIDPPIE